MKIPKTYDIWINRGDYSVLLTKVAGVTFGGRQAVVGRLRAGDELVLRGEPENDVDFKAILVRTKRGSTVGYVPRDLIDDVDSQIDRCFVVSVGGSVPRLGVRILLVKENA